MSGTKNNYVLSRMNFIAFQVSTLFEVVQKNYLNFNFSTRSMLFSVLLFGKYCTHFEPTGTVVLHPQNISSVTSVFRSAIFIVDSRLTVVVS